MPKVSVIVAAYNVEEYIEECLHSLINQTLEDVEFIVVDDGSTDTTHKIICELAKADHRIKVIKNKQNSGTMLTCKYGCDAATGEYIMFLDGDDILDFKACETAYNAINKENVDILQFEMNIFAEKEVLEKKSREIQSAYKYLKGPSMKIFAPGKAGLLGSKLSKDKLNFTMRNKIFKKQLVDAANSQLPNEHLIVAEDVLFSFIACFLAKSYSYINKKLYNYRFGSGISTSKTISETRLNAIAKCYFIYDYLKNWTKQNGALKICKTRLESLKMQMLENIGYALLVQCPKEKQNSFVNRVLEYCPVENFISIISYMVNNQCIKRRDELAEICANLDIFKTVRKDKRTIGTFYFRVYNGGIENVISQLTDIWVKNGYNVVLFTDQPKSDDDYYINPKIKRVILPEYVFDKYSSYADRVKDFRENLQKYNVDIMVYHAWMFHYIVYDELIVKSLGIPFISHTHGVCCTDFQSTDSYCAFINTKLPKMYALCDNVITLTQADQAYWKSFNLNAIQTTNPSPLPLNTKTSQLKSNNVVMTCRISQEKQVLDAIKIVEQVSLKIPDVTFTIVGGGDECYKNDLTNYIKEHKLDDIVKMVGFKKNVLPYYQSADVMLITSKIEGFCLSLLEGKICGLPLVIYDLPNLDTVRDAKGMAVVPQNDIDAAAEKIIEILSDDKLKKQMGKEARESAEEILSIDLAKHWDYIFEKTLNPDTAEIKKTPEQSAINTLVHYTGQGILARMYTQPQIQYQQVPLEVPNKDWLRQSHYAETLEATIKEIRSSTSYKLGWFLTTIPRKIKDFIKGQKYVE